MIETGIPKLDDYLGGGIPEGKSLVYFNHPGVEGNVFGMQTLYHNLKTGKFGIFVTSSSSPKTIRDQFKEFGWDLDSFGNKFIMIDAYSSLIGSTSEEQYIVKEPDKIESLNDCIDEVIRKISSPGVVVFGSLSTIMDLCGEEKTVEAVRLWNKVGIVYNHTPIYNFTAWPYSKKTMDTIKSDLFNAVISIGGIAERVIFGQYFGVIKVDWAKGTRKSILFRVMRPGGVKVYIPKILITGPFNAGKSTFVHALSTRAVSVDRLGTTIALDHGHVDHKGFSADIFGTPGQERFDPIIKLLSGEALGVFLIIDSTNPKDFHRAKYMLELTMTYGLPYVIVANKQDINGALSIEEIRECFKVPKDINIVPAVAKEGKGIFEAFEVLVDRIMRNE